MCFLLLSDFKSLPQPLKSNTFRRGNQSNKVANFFRKSCPSKQRVLILEGGYRGWEAHDLPIQQMEATLSQKACDQLALKIGQNVSKVKWGGLWSAQSFSMAGTAENLQWVSPLGRGQHCFARKTLKRREL